MSKINIMLVCSAGMSTSMLVTRMEKAAESAEIEANTFAVSADEADDHIDKGGLDVLLLGPQVKFMKDKFVKKTEGTSILVDVIDMKDYGIMNGEKVLNDTMEKLK